MENKQAVSNAVEVLVPEVAVLSRRSLSVGIDPEDGEDMDLFTMVNRVVLLGKAERERQKYGVKQVLMEYLVPSPEFQAALARWDEKFGGQPCAAGAN